MIDVKEIRANPERMREAIRLRKVDPTRADLDRWLELDEQRRHLQGLLEEINAEKNRLAQLGKTDPAAARRKGQEIRQKARALDEQLARVTKEWQSILDWFPNWPDPQMPRGDGEDDNVEECAWIPGVGYVDPDRLGKGAHTAPLMPQHSPHADDPDFRPTSRSGFPARANSWK
jgi:seryl-tRNA synthetase